MLFHGPLFSLALFEIQDDDEVVPVVASATLALKLLAGVSQRDGRTRAVSAIGSVSVGSVRGRLKSVRPVGAVVGAGSVVGKIGR